MKNVLALGMCAMIWAACGCSANNPPRTVSSVDLNRYAGKWYEIAKYPVSFEAGCSGVTAEYSPRPDGKIEVVNTCHEGRVDGPARTIKGTAVSTNAPANSRLDVTFFLFPAPYWIIELDPSYQWAVVSEPSRSKLWILCRTPRMDAATYGKVTELIKAQGFDLSRLVATDQPATP